MRGAIGSIIVSAALLLAPLGSGAAQESADTDSQARVHFQAGTNYFQVGDYASALREYERSYELSRRPELLYNLFMCHERLGQLEEAVLTLDRFLGERPDIDGREALEARLDTLRRRLDDERDARPGESAEPGEAEPSHATPTEGAPSGERDAADTSASVPTQAAPSEVAPSEDRPVETGGGMTGATLGMLAVTTGLAALWGASGITALVLDGELTASCGSAVVPTCNPTDTETLFTVSVIADALLGLSAASALVLLIVALTTGDAPASGEETLVALPFGDARTAGVSLMGRW